MPKKRNKNRRFGRWTFLLLLAAILLGGFLWLSAGTAPMPAGRAFYVRYERPTTLPKVLSEMQRKGVVRDPTAFRVYAFITRTPTQIRTGTYQVRPGMTARELLNEFRKPFSQKVRIPETNWAQRTANLLDTKYQVCSADEYMALYRDPKQFHKLVSFPLPSTTLEGYLYPDTYDLPPLLGARAVIERQLKAFERKVWEPLNHPADLPRILTVASMVELEAGRDDERAAIAGVIENRLKKKMRLQIDATILYGIQRWKRLTNADYKNLDTPYNTYLHEGLPPGPICSPSLKSIEAAMKPDTSGDSLFYVAMPGQRSAFASTYKEHLKNVKKRRDALKELGQ
ncbi:endolytic transglycosylase MltG [Fimbriimonas ginsengisoli]|uniref:Endolytic murein transglycosylase n=1 Tax=Fimbriimonas ginsengisoli Gsoil 348 TaxID=661478 RepID=A0A068NLX7_FIMGI|nr:endolytic transglycosylase MltG [Fimbriimonas ginsengisoli]AIE84422.1 aminodeoxychorismate lyase [Fimbriimonas ginsengisoli Gsoil 348]